MKIYYLVPFSDKPSWGMGIIYDHVSILNSCGFQANVIKKEDCKVPAWLNFAVPIKDYNYLNRHVQSEDILVVPEAMLDLPGLKEMKCRKILFIQAPAFMFESMPANEDHRSLGFEHVMTIMPHMNDIVSKHLQLPYTQVPPYLADYFFKKKRLRRKRQVLLFPKFHQIDYSIVKYLIKRHLQKRNASWLKDLISGSNWSIKELRGFNHEEVAEIMQESEIFISINTFEALNTSVVEAMASGCIVFCYEGFGPRDYLRNGENAWVFSNNEAYLLAEAVCDQIDLYDEKETVRNSMREQAYATAEKYTRQFAAESLISFMKNFTSNSKEGVEMIPS